MMSPRCDSHDADHQVRIPQAVDAIDAGHPCSQFIGPAGGQESDGDGRLARAGDEGKGSGAAFHTAPRPSALRRRRTRARAVSLGKQCSRLLVGTLGKDQP
jgi:hypothetical protein